MAALVEETENLTISGSPDKQVDTRFYSKLAIDQQRELFLWKYPDIKREAVLTSEAGFIKHNLTKSGQLDEHEAAMYLEDMGVAKTGSEIRQMFVNMDKDGNHLISFVEW
jgi:Ca2+-binding EF-hand superfamily protein